VSDLERLWTNCADALKAQVSEGTWHTWFAGLAPVSLDEGQFVIAVPSTIVRDRLETHYRELVTDTVTDTLGTPHDVVLEVIAPEPGQQGLTADDLIAERDHDRAVRDAVRFAPVSNDCEAAGPLNPGYQFEAFVIGASNRFAHAAALSVAERPAKSWNPLFIYGGPGLGKTHLLHAIGHFVRAHYPAYRVRYASAETFTNEFIDALRSNHTNQFKRLYRECDVLLIDDIQFMEGKESTKEEFFHTFNSLHGNSRQIVITSDRPPKSLTTLEDRLRSRFEWGLVTDVQPPELETRIAILRKKAEREPTRVPDEVLEFIATNVRDNIRILEGALHRVTAFASLSHEELDEALARRVLQSLFAGDQPQQVTARMILDATARMFGFTLDELCGPNRRRPLVTARQIAMYVMRELTDFSYPAIAREFGGRDHTTVIHAVEKIASQMKERRTIYDQVTELISVITRGG
jgi:chromosomal replication initiator protein